MSPEREILASETWQRTLSRIPAYLGRLAYLASLRDPNTGNYQHFGVAQRFGETEADRLIRQSHMELFQAWLCFGLERQKQEVEEYLNSLEGDCREILSHWLRLHPYVNWIPAESRDGERQLFSTDLDIVSELLRSDYGVSSPDRDL